MSDWATPGMDLKGEAHGRSKLTREEAIELRCRYAIYQWAKSLTVEHGPRKLAEEYGVSTSTAASIGRSESWQHLPDYVYLGGEPRIHDCRPVAREEDEEYTFVIEDEEEEKEDCEGCRMFGDNCRIHGEGDW